MNEGVKLYGTRDAATYLGYKDVKMVKIYAKSGRLKGTNISGKAWVFTKEQLDEFKANMPKTGPKPKGETDG